MIDLFLDLETGPTENVDIRDHVTQKIKPPRSIKKAETLERWNLEDRPEAEAAALSGMALDGETAEILMIGYAVGEAPPNVLHSMNEPTMLRLFFKTIGDIARHNAKELTGARTQVRVIAHNAPFDIGMLYKRAAILGVDRPYWFPWRAKPWEFDKVFCTMRAWDSERRTSLDELCFYLGIPSPKRNGIKGDMVAQMIKDGRLQEAVDYCAEDVTSMRECAYAMALETDGF